MCAGKSHLPRGRKTGSARCSLGAMSVRTIGRSGALGSTARWTGHETLVSHGHRGNKERRADGLFASRLLWVRCASVIRRESKSEATGFVLSVLVQYRTTASKAPLLLQYGNGSDSEQIQQEPYRYRAGGLSSERLSEQISQR